VPTPQKFTDMELVATWNRNHGNVSRTAEELGVTRRAVKNRKEKLPSALFSINLQEFRQNRADLFAEIQKVAMVYLLDAKKLAKASPQQLITMMAIAYDKERLEKNLSTENIAHNHYQNLDQQDRDMLKKFIAKRTEKKLGEIQYGDDG
jgi:hypothetical protein